jgi:hypothetical protein
MFRVSTVDKKGTKIEMRMLWQFSNYVIVILLTNTWHFKSIAIAICFRSKQMIDIY